VGFLLSALMPVVYGPGGISCIYLEFGISRSSRRHDGGGGLVAPLFFNCRSHAFFPSGSLTSPSDPAQMAAAAQTFSSSWPASGIRIRTGLPSTARTCAGLLNLTEFAAGILPGIGLKPVVYINRRNADALITATTSLPSASSNSRIESATTWAVNCCPPHCSSTRTRLPTVISLRTVQGRDCGRWSPRGGA
jgi:hypothetical protein